MLNNLNSERMKTAKQILSDITGYSVDELTERNTEPLLQAEDCLTAMYCFLAQMQANGDEQGTSNCNIPHVSIALENKRKDFCTWYYAQSQPLDANKVFKWFSNEC